MEREFSTAEDLVGLEPANTASTLRILSRLLRFCARCALPLPW